MNLFRRARSVLGGSPDAPASRSYTLGEIEIGGPWACASSGTPGIGGGFFTLTNKGATPERLAGSLQWALGGVEPNGQRVLRLRLMAKKGEEGKADLQSSVKVTFQTGVQSSAVCVQRRPELALGVGLPSTKLITNALKPKDRSESK